MSKGVKDLLMICHFLLLFTIFNYLLIKYNNISYNFNFFLKKLIIDYKIIINSQRFKYRRKNNYLKTIN